MIYKNSLFSVKEAAKILKYSPKTVYNMVENGEIDAIKSMNKVQISSIHMEKYCDSRVERAKNYRDKVLSQINGI